MPLILLLGVASYLQCFHCQYILIENSKSWDEAQTFCTEQHLHLATVQNESDWEKLRVELSTSDSLSEVWLGLYNDMNSWRWSFQNQNVTFNKWNPSEPNNYRGHEECGEFHKYRDQGGWNDANCFMSLPCVCYDGMTNRFVLVNDTLRSWHDAQSYCRHTHTDLATVRSADDHQQLIALTSADYSAWIGLFRGAWRWVDGTPLSSRPVTWSNNQPDNSAQDEACGCADAAGHTADHSCSLLLPFICSTGERRQIVRLEVKSFSNIQNDIQTNILQQMQQMLSRQGLTVKIRWRVQTDGRVFHERGEGNTDV